MSNPSPCPFFQLTFGNNSLAVRSTLRKFTSTIKHLGVDNNTAHDVELVLAEALNNVIEHAYPESASGKIELTCFQEEIGLRVEIKDFGIKLPCGMLNFRSLPDPSAKLKDLPEGGFGWCLINTLTNDLSYVRGNNSNCLTLKFQWNWPARAQK